MTNLPTFSQIRSTNFTQLDINFGIELFFLGQLKLKLELLQELKSLNKYLDKIDLKNYLKDIKYYDKSGYYWNGSMWSFNVESF